MPSSYSSPSLSLHSPSTEWTILTETESQAQLSQQQLLAKTSLPDAKPSQLIPGVVSGSQPTRLSHSICMASTTTEGAPVEEGLPEEANEVGDSRKNRQRQNHVHHWQQFTRAQFPGRRFPAKFGYQPIKLELYPLVHTHTANCVRVHVSHLGVYKESPVAHRATRVRVS